MKHQVIHTDNAPKAIGPYSQAVKAGNMLFVSGQVPFVPETMEIVEGDVKAQTAQSLKNLQAILKEAGADFSDVVKTTVFIKDMEKLRAEEIADTFKVVVSKIEKGEMKFFVVRDLFLNFDAYKGKIVDAIGKSTVPIKAGDMAALRTMYNSDTGNMNTVLETMVKRGTLTDEQITEIKEQRKS